MQAKYELMQNIYGACQSMNRIILTVHLLMINNEKKCTIYHFTYLFKNYLSDVKVMQCACYLQPRASKNVERIEKSDISSSFVSDAKKMVLGRLTNG